MKNFNYIKQIMPTKKQLENEILKIKARLEVSHEALLSNVKVKMKYLEENKAFEKVVDELANTINTLVKERDFEHIRYLDEQVRRGDYQEKNEELKKEIFCVDCETGELSDKKKTDELEKKLREYYGVVKTRIMGLGIMNGAPVEHNDIIFYLRSALDALDNLKERNIELFAMYEAEKKAKFDLECKLDILKGD